ncbi:DUF6069 family protein [Actinoplanes sp. NBC_00393]|uniref:DUF6069 family protein n=1 Tax=Actinoplanes sp. NBC_00393 TaxID=2975953 RepID=UPI002E239FF4
MRTLALRGGERVAVIAAQWHNAFAVVTRGRVQLELRDGEPGPVLGRDAGFWLRGTGVRALRNPGLRTAQVRIVTPHTPRSREHDMISTTPAPARHTHRFRGLAGTGLLATVAAMIATTLAAALARAAGVDFEVPDGGETIPLSGIAVVTGFFSLVGVVMAAAFLRWSVRPAERFLWTTAALTAVSLIPPFIAGADTATVTALLGLHLVAAAVMIPALTRSLRTKGDGAATSS